MKRSDLDQVCDANTSDGLKDRLAMVLQALEGISAAEARKVVRFAHNAIDDLPLMPTYES